ncbi:MAG: hypothetical protein Q9219_005527 [cf. Caloplaca sp. 3 TL-2023]
MATFKANNLLPRPDRVDLPTYKIPETGLLSWFPAHWIPYAELIRLNKPAGWIYLYFPSLFSSLLASCLVEPVPPPSKLFWVNVLLLLEAIIHRSFACVWNDILDRDIDRKVTRTRLRPMARGAVSTGNAVIFTMLQVAVGAGLAYYMRPECFYYTLPFDVILALYPYAKRVTYYPSLVLGFGWAWGAIVGFPAIKPDPFTSNTVVQAAACLYASNMAWCNLYDTIYSYQDLKDDKLAGVKSVPVKFEDQTQVILVGLAVLQIALLVPCGHAMNASPWYYIGTCAGGGLTLAMMIVMVDLAKPESCMWWFKWGSLITGCMMATGFLCEYQRLL